MARKKKNEPKLPPGIKVEDLPDGRKLYYRDYGKGRKFIIKVE